MGYRITAACSLWALAACATAPEPTEHLAASMAALRAAETAGAANVPQAQLHMKLAQEQIENAQRLIRDDDNERANAMTIRAYNDAELALALTREAELKQAVAQHTSAKGQATTSTPGSAPHDATNPPGVGAPNNAPSSSQP